MLLRPLPANALPGFRPPHQPFDAAVSVSMSTSFQVVIRTFEERPAQSFTVLEVARAHRIPHRRAYDFFNFLSAFGVCSTVTRGTLRWNGIGFLPQALAGAYAQIEVAACACDLRALFAAGSSPTLGALATKFACLFLFLGTDILSIRAVTQLIRDADHQGRSLERRLYLAVSFLEAAAVVAHTARPSEYRLVVDRRAIVAAGMHARKEYLRESESRSFENLLSRYGDAFMKQLYEERKAELARILSE
jgi:hypothetical protein